MLVVKDPPPTTTAFRPFYELDTCISLTGQMGKLRLGEVKYLAQINTGRDNTKGHA